MNSRLVIVFSLLCVFVLSGVAVAGQGSAAQVPEPTVQDVYVVMRDMNLAYETVEIHTIVPNEEGASALIGLDGGTLVDVVLSPVANGWTLRDIYYVAGNADDYRAFAGPWRARVAEAERFLAAAGDDDRPQRRAEDLAPLVWFEDLDESDRLWGLNPTTYRIMQTLRMMPTLSGPMGGSGRNQ